ncbi:hypothetical protein H5410_053666 [Solanum commersonii]|uniref:eRF1/Pelota-like N-terminal domain-containing protein n=1 Tax=Solanum commersonii TaxID=4109 RepID=A0A9J5X5I4_SOLCO|nr:hypothetical protein H5410_053666 [Solanum commersonii]
MKLSGEKLVPNQPGTITIIPEKTDDFWLLFNLIANDDVIRRKRRAALGFKLVQLEIKITNVDYAKDCSTIRVRGKTITSNEYVNPGTFHTLELETDKEALGRRND